MRRVQIINQQLLEPQRDKAALWHARPALYWAPQQALVRVVILPRIRSMRMVRILNQQLLEPVKVEEVLGLVNSQFSGHSPQRDKAALWHT